MQKRNRLTGRKYPKRQIVTMNNSSKSEAFSDGDARLEPRQYATGVIQHPITKLYQVWISTNGLDVTCITAHYDIDLARNDLQEVNALIRSGDLYSNKKTDALFQKLEEGSDEKPQTLPDELVSQIVREILRAIVDRPSS